MESLPDIDQWLDEVARIARQGTGRSFWCTCRPNSVPAIQAGLLARLDSLGIPLVTVRLGSDLPRAWQPFDALLGRDRERFGDKALLKRIRGAFCFRPQRERFLAWAGLGPPPRGDAEPDIPEEQSCWQRIAQRGVEQLVRQSVGDHPLVLFCTGAELLPPESLDLMASLQAGKELPLIFVNCFHREPTVILPKLDELYHRLDSHANLHHLESVELLTQLPPLAATDNERLSSFMDLSCPKTAEIWLQAHLAQQEASLAQGPGLQHGQVWFRCLLARSLSDQGRFEEALTEVQAAWMDLNMEADATTALPVLELLSWIQASNADTDSAARTAWQAWHLARKTSSAVWQTRAAFAFLRVKAVGNDYSDLPRDLEGSLEREFTAYRWQNHLAFVLCMSAIIVPLTRADRLDEAEERCAESLRIARRMGNRRREINAWHMLGLVAQRREDWPKAETYYHRARRMMAIWSIPTDLAKSHNGLGYYYFTRGKYDQAQRQYSLALDSLQGSSLFGETLQTLVNLARVQLWNGQARAALRLFETVVSVLDQLHQIHLPLLSRRDLLCFMGVAAFKAGQFEQSLGLSYRLHLVPLRPSDDETSLPLNWFQSLLATRSLDLEAAHRNYLQIMQRLGKLAAGEQSGVIQVMLDQAEWLHAKFRPAAARQLAEQIRKRLKEEGSPLEQQRLQALEQGGPPPHFAAAHHGDLQFGSLMQLVERQRLLSQLRRNLKDTDFLKRWQELMARVKTEEGLLLHALRLIQQRWLVDDAVFHSPNQSTVVPGKRLAALVAHAAAEGWNGAHASFDPGAPAFTGLAAWSWIPLNLDGLNQYQLVIGTARTSLDFGPATHQLLQLACFQLSTTLLVMQREAHLERSERLAALGGMVAGIAHEINTPLGIAVTGSSYLIRLVNELKLDFQNAKLSRANFELHLTRLAEGGNLILRNLEHAERLIRTFKMVSTDQGSEDRRVFRLADYLQEVIASLKPRLDKQAVLIRLDTPAELEMDSYPGALYQIVTNLVMNSLLHGFEGRSSGEISIVTKEAAGLVTLCFSDDGCGVSPEILPRIFNPFFTTKRAQGGTGLGLHIVHNLASQVLGGTIEAQSLPGEGASFTLRVPRVAPALPTVQDQN